MCRAAAHKHTNAHTHTHRHTDTHTHSHTHTYARTGSSKHRLDPISPPLANGSDALVHAFLQQSTREAATYVYAWVCVHACVVCMLAEGGQEISTNQRSERMNAHTHASLPSHVLHVERSQFTNERKPKANDPNVARVLIRCNQIKHAVLVLDGEAVHSRKRYSSTQRSIHTTSSQKASWSSASHQQHTHTHECASK